MKYSLITHWRAGGPRLLGPAWGAIRCIWRCSDCWGLEMYFAGRKRADVRDLDADFEWYM